MSKPRFTPALTNLTLVHQGKTRDTFETKDPGALLVVASQRLSTHNVIHKSSVPFKDQVLTALTVFWLTELFEKNYIRHHLLAWGMGIYDYLPGTLADYPADLRYRAIIVKKLSMIPVEFILRSYLTGSLFRDYYSKNKPNPYGITLGDDLQQMSPFRLPIFTPTDKSETDEPLDTLATLAKYPEASHLSHLAFTLIRDHLQAIGLELVDSKFEIGMDHLGNTTVADEIVTPDSSRFCERSAISLGKEPPWLDKQIARDEAERIWNKGEKFPIEFSPDIIKKLSDTYRDIFTRITGLELRAFQRKILC